jgi:hypothetical protein
LHVLSRTPRSPLIHWSIINTCSSVEEISNSPDKGLDIRLDVVQIIEVLEGGKELFGDVAGMRGQGDAVFLVVLYLLKDRVERQLHVMSAFYTLTSVYSMICFNASAEAVTGAPKKGTMSPIDARTESPSRRGPKSRLEGISYPTRARLELFAI